MIISFGPSRAKWPLWLWTIAANVQVVWVGLRVCSHLAQFYVHRMNTVDSSNDFVMVAAPRTLSLTLYVVVVVVIRETVQLNDHSPVALAWRRRWVRQSPTNINIIQQFIIFTKLTRFTIAAKLACISDFRVARSADNWFIRFTQSVSPSVRSFINCIIYSRAQAACQ